MRGHFFIFEILIIKVRETLKDSQKKETKIIYDSNIP